MEGSAITASNAVRGKLRFDTFSDFEAGLEIGAGANILIRKDEIGTPGKIRTYDLLLRRHGAYPNTMIIEQIFLQENSI